MGRDRATKRGNRLPPYVYRKEKLNAVEYRPYVSKVGYKPPIYLKDEEGKNLPWTASISDILRAYSRVTESAPTQRTLGWLLDEYVKSPRHGRLADSTKKHYATYRDTIKAAKLASGRMFGDFPLEKLSRPVLAKYRDSLAETPIMANRHLQFLSAVFSWGLEQGHLTENAAQGVEKNPAPPRTNYVTDADYFLALDLAPAWLRAAMELAYLCRARRGEVFGLTGVHIGEAGIHVKRTKGSKSEITQWSDRLRAAVALAKTRYPDAQSSYLIHNEDGSKIKDTAFNSAWSRLMKKAAKQGLAKSFPYHDLKAKGITDHTEHAGGHKSERMREVYIRLPDEVPATR